MAPGRRCLKQWKWRGRAVTGGTPRSKGDGEPLDPIATPASLPYHLFRSPLATACSPWRLPTLPRRDAGFARRRCPPSPRGRAGGGSQVKKELKSFDASFHKFYGRQPRSVSPPGRLGTAPPVPRRTDP